MMELCTANDLNNMVPSPYEGTETVTQPSPQCIKGILVGAESETDSIGEDSGNEWDREECGTWSCCPSLPMKVGPTWAEVHAAAQEQKALEKDTTTWEDIVGKHLPEDIEGEDSDWDEEECRVVESQFEDTAVAVEAETEDPMEESAVEVLPVGHIDEASVGLGSQDVVQIHTGEDYL